MGFLDDVFTSTCSVCGGMFRVDSGGKVAAHLCMPRLLAVLHEMDARYLAVVAEQANSLSGPGMSLNPDAVAHAALGILERVLTP